MTGDDDAPHSNYWLIVVLSALIPPFASGCGLLWRVPSMLAATLCTISATARAGFFLTLMVVAALF
jgi:hypothetical protein